MNADKIYGKKCRASAGLYTGDFHKRITKEKNIFYDINPLQANSEILQQAELFRAESKKDFFNAIHLIHDQVRVGGALGVEFNIDVERPDGCFRADEFIVAKKGVCLEQTYLFLSMLINGGANDEQTTILGFMTRQAFGRNNIDHAFAAALVNNIPQEFVHLAYSRFYHDREFREKILAAAGRNDDEKLGLMILDLTTPGVSYVGFGAANHKRIVPFSDESLLASYFINSGTYFLERHQEQEALNRYNAALTLCQDAYLAVDGISNYLMSQKRYSEVIELTSKIWKNLSPRSIVNRSIALFKTGHINIGELFTSLQLSIDYPTAYLFVSDVLRDIGLYSEAKHLLEVAVKKLELELDKMISANRGVDSAVNKFQIALLEDDLLECLSKLKRYGNSI